MQAPKGGGASVSQSVLQQTLLHRIGMNTDNIFIQYFLGLFAVSMLGTLTALLPKLLKFFQSQVSKYFEPNYPTLKFVVTRDKRTTYLNNATNAAIAWMEQIETVIDARHGIHHSNNNEDDDNDSNPYMKNWTNFLSLNALNPVFNSKYALMHNESITKVRNVATGRGTRNVRTGLLNDTKNHWLPDQNESFLIADDIYAKLQLKTLEHKEKGDAYSTEEYTLSIYTTRVKSSSSSSLSMNNCFNSNNVSSHLGMNNNTIVVNGNRIENNDYYNDENNDTNNSGNNNNNNVNNNGRDNKLYGLKYLINYHNRLVSNYELSLKSKFENKPHIFEFDSINTKDDSIKWIANEFSSSRQLSHLWFESKDTFMKSYENFLFNKKEYDRRGDPYTFSILLYGPPGCGKTSLLKALINFDLNQRQKRRKMYQRTMKNGNNNQSHNNDFDFEEYKDIMNDFNETQAQSDIPFFISHLFVIPFSKIENITTFNKIMFDKNVNGTEIPMNQRIYVFEDFDANIQSNIFNIRESLKESYDSINWNATADGNILPDSLLSQAAANNSDEAGATGTDIAGMNGTGLAANEDEKESKENTKDDENEMALQKLKHQSDTLNRLKSILFTSDKKDDFSKKSGNLFLSDILNTLDGLCERTGQRCIWTTNKSPPQKYFDPAFLRPGRMDMIIKLGPCNHVGIEYLLKQYFDIQNTKIDLCGVKQKQFTPAQIKQICKETGDLQSAIKMLKQVSKDVL